MARLFPLETKDLSRSPPGSVIDNRNRNGKMTEIMSGAEREHVLARAKRPSARRRGIDIDQAEEEKISDHPVPDLDGGSLPFLLIERLHDLPVVFTFHLSLHFRLVPLPKLFFMPEPIPLFLAYPVLFRLALDEAAPVVLAELLDLNLQPFLLGQSVLISHEPILSYKLFRYYSRVAARGTGRFRKEAMAHYNELAQGPDDKGIAEICPPKHKG